MACQNDINSTHKISYNFQNMVQPLEMHHASQDDAFFENMYNDLRKVMGDCYYSFLIQYLMSYTLYNALSHV